MPDSVASALCRNLSSIVVADTIMSTMKVAFIFFTTIALWLHPASGSSVASAVNGTVLTCRSDERSYIVHADFGVWRSIKVLISNLSGQCTVNVTWAAASVKPVQPARQLLLVRVDPLYQILSSKSTFCVAMFKPSRRTLNYCTGLHCGPTFLWASEPVQLYLHLGQSVVEKASYEASFITSEATNVCDFANRTGELVVKDSRIASAQYVFASDARFSQLPPNNVSCTGNVEYSLIVSSSVASAPLSVTVHVCPSNDSCGTLTLNGRSCSDVEIGLVAQPGSNVTLRYWLRNCENGNSKFFAGFIVNARVGVWAEQPFTMLVATTVTVLAAAAAAVGVVVALLCRRRRQRLSDSKLPSSIVQQSRSLPSNCKEEVAMIDNDLYDTALASKTTAAS